MYASARQWDSNFIKITAHHGRHAQFNESTIAIRHGSGSQSASVPLEVVSHTAAPSREAETIENKVVA
jgi:hypothetical protein